MVDTSRLGETPTPNIINELVKDEEVETISLGESKISKKDRDLYDISVQGLVRNMNQTFYRKFKQQLGTDIVPVYAQYVKSGNLKGIKIFIRKDWLKKKYEANLSFAEWLIKKGKRNLAVKLEEWEKSPSQQKPHWIKREWKKWQEEGGINLLFEQSQNKGAFAFKSKYDRVSEITTKGKSGRIQGEVKQLYTKPLKSADFEKLIDPENEDFIFGDRNVKNYFSSSMSDEKERKIYRDVMKGVLDEYWKIYEQIQAVGLSTPEGLENVEALTNFEADFPNIERIRKWFIKKGIYQNSPQFRPSNRYYTLEKFNELKTNTQRANFIDRATFLIANSIYIKNNNIKVRANSQSGGKKVPISRARAYKKYSKDRNKYSTERVKQYEGWKVDNRKIASSLKRTINRQDNRKRSR